MDRQPTWRDNTYIHLRIWNDWRDQGMARAICGYLFFMDDCVDVKRSRSFSAKKMRGPLTVDQLACPECLVVWDAFLQTGERPLTMKRHRAIMREVFGRVLPEERGWRSPYDPEKPVWVTSDFCPVPVVEMTDSHLANTVAFVARARGSDVDAERRRQWLEVLRAEQARRVAQELGARVARKGEPCETMK